MSGRATRNAACSKICTIITALHIVVGLNLFLVNAFGHLRFRKIAKHGSFDPHGVNNRRRQQGCAAVSLFARRARTHRRISDEHSRASIAAPTKTNGLKGKRCFGKQRKEVKERTVVLIYHKPKDFITTHSTERQPHDDRPNVYDDLIGDDLRSFQEKTRIRSKLHAVGRLDAATTGALLFTNDGALVHHVTNPVANSRNRGDDDEKSKSVKVYTALVMGRFEDTESPRLKPILSGGVPLTKTERSAPVIFLQILDHPSAKTTLLRLGLSEGKNRQIRRMFHNVQSGVIQLHRDSVGDVDLEGVETPGQWRILTEEEVRQKLGYESRVLNSNARLNLSHGIISRKK